MQYGVSGTLQLQEKKILRRHAWKRQSRNSSNKAEYDKIIKANDNGFTHLILSVTADKDIDAVADAITTEFDTGCLKTAWDNLNKNY